MAATRGRGRANLRSFGVLGDAPVRSRPSPAHASLARTSFSPKEPRADPVSPVMAPCPRSNFRQLYPIPTDGGEPSSLHVMSSKSRGSPSLLESERHPCIIRGLDLSTTFRRRSVAGGLRGTWMTRRTAKFPIGLPVRHRIYGFRGVIFDVDAEFNNTEEWYGSIPEEVRPRKDQPFYHLFAETAERQPYIAYVSEQNLVAEDGDEPPIRGADPEPSPCRCSSRAGGMAAMCRGSGRTDPFGGGADPARLRPCTRRREAATPPPSIRYSRCRRTTRSLPSIAYAEEPISSDAAVTMGRPTLGACPSIPYGLRCQF